MNIEIDIPDGISGEWSNGYKININLLKNGEIIGVIPFME